jgi:hypothetical protein
MTKRNKPVLEPRTQAFIDTLEAKGGAPLYTLSYEDACKVLDDRGDGERLGGYFKDAGAGRGFAETRIFRKPSEEDLGRKLSSRDSRSHRRLERTEDVR